MDAKQKTTPAATEKLVDRELQLATDVLQQRQYYRRLPKKAGQLLNQIMARKAVANVHALNQLQSVWENAIRQSQRENPQTEKLLLGCTRLGKLDRGVLEVHVDNSAALQQLAFMKSPLLQQIRQSIPQSKIRDLRFRSSG